MLKGSLTMDELIICVAPYPGEKQVEKFSGKMDVAEEVIRSYQAGASIAHLHVRDENGLQTTDLRCFQRDFKKIRSGCSIIVEGSTGGAPEHTLEERCLSFRVPGIELGSLNIGSINMFDGVYQNPVAHMQYYAQELKIRGIKPFLCVFDLSEFYNLDELEKEGFVTPPHLYNLVFDIPGTLPYSKKVLDIFLSYVPKGAPWFMSRHHSKGWESFRAALELGGHVRVGYEDGPFLASGERARSNAELVEEVVKAAHTMGRKVVGPDRAREMLGLKPLR
jgi:3-keto-5-aminohexanoate cleavage enzyme